MRSFPSGTIIDSADRAELSLGTYTDKALAGAIAATYREVVVPAFAPPAERDTPVPVPPKGP